MGPAFISPRRWLVSFGLTVGILVGLAVWIALRLPSFRDPPINFNSISPKERFMTEGLTRRQEGSVKLGFAENYDPPQIGVYGNHIVRLFGGEAFGHPNDPAYFFNYWYANLALPEIYRYLRHIEELGRLPKKLILVQITSPNLDNGDFIINFGNELPPDLLLVPNADESMAEKAARLGVYAWEMTENWLHETLNYSTFILGLARDEGKNRVVDLTNCGAAETTTLLSIFLRRMPIIPQNVFSPAEASGDFCQSDYRWAALRRDGSTDPQYTSKRLVRNEERLLESKRHLRGGDEYEIARQLRAIDDVGRRNSVNVVFLLPPGFESIRENSVVNQIFDRGLALAPGLTIVDDRAMHDDPSLFLEYDHPSPEYFRLLADELRHRGLVPDH
jgi:hypothetical protein